MYMCVFAHFYVQHINLCADITYACVHFSVYMCSPTLVSVPFFMKYLSVHAPVSVYASERERECIMER